LRLVGGATAAYTVFEVCRSTANATTSL
jgi:hypothetical protein